MPEFLLEVGFEEMPAGWLPRLTDQLRDEFARGAAREQLAPEGVEAFGTPRRLVLRAGLRARQESRRERVWGPALQIAQDAQGKWLPPALGFAKKQGRAVADLKVGDKGQPPARYVMIDLDIEGKSATEVLPSLISEALRSLSFPKRMSWDAWLDDGRGALPFGRPVRWLLALLEGQVVPFAIHERAGGEKGRVLVEAGRVTFAHRFLPPGEAGRAREVRGFSDLQETLRRGCVLLDPQERAARIREGLLAASPRNPRTGHPLVAEWCNLVEYPTVMVGRIPSEFGSLPADVVETVLVHHQKYVPLSSEGEVASRFAAITNTEEASAPTVVRGMERVVVARLRDAAFFFGEDRKRPLSARIDDLAGVAFHQGLGSYREKTERMVRLVDALYEGDGVLTKDEHEAAREAARLAKADLTTLMVREFPELQGVMGGIYLAAEGNEWQSVVKAVRWHYHPLSVEEEAPPKGALQGSEATIFGAVSIADKLDTLAGYFGLEMGPKGSSDPYGLRRAGQGVVRVLLDFWGSAESEARPNLEKLIEAAVAGYGAALKAPPPDVKRSLALFFLERMGYVFRTRGFPADEVEACLYAEDPQSGLLDSRLTTSQALVNVYDCYVRLQALHRVRREAPEDFEHLAVAFKRAKNILEQAGQRGHLVPAELKEPAEQELYRAVARLAHTNGSYEGRLRALAGLRAPVDRFFDDVLVMAEEEKVKANRLGLLSEALALFYRIADISKLGGQP